MHVLEPAAFAPSAFVPETAPRPTGLSAPQVLERFSREAHRWRMETGSETVHGWSLGNGPPLFFLPPAGVSSRVWVFAAWLLRRDFQCIGYDLPPARPWRSGDGLLRRTSAMLLAAAKELKLHRAAVAAAGVGCLTAFQSLREAPSRFSFAVLFNPMAARRLSLFERLLTHAGRWCPGTMKRIPLWRKMLIESHRRWFPPFDMTRWGLYESEVAGSRISSIAEDASMWLAGTRASLGEIVQPVLLVGTEGEGALNSRGRFELRGRLSAARAAWLENCGQLVFLSHPHRVATTIRDFAANPAPGCCSTSCGEACPS